MTLALCVATEKVLDRNFTETDCTVLAKLIRQSGKANEYINDNAPLRPLSDFIVEV